MYILTNYTEETVLTSYEIEIIDETICQFKDEDYWEVTDETGELLFSTDVPF